MYYEEIEWINNEAWGKGIYKIVDVRLADGEEGEPSNCICVKLQDVRDGRLAYEYVADFESIDAALKKFGWFKSDASAAQAYIDGEFYA